MDSTAAHAPDDEQSLAAEVRQSLLLLGISVGVTLTVTAAAHATLLLFG